MARVVLLIPTSTYRAPDFVEAASALSVEVVVASEEEQALAGAMGGRALVIPFDDPEAAAARIVDYARHRAVDAVVAIDEAGVVPAAMAAARLGLPHNPPDAVAATRDKARMRRRLAEAGLPQPPFRVVGPGEDVAAVARDLGLPCVVKPVSLSAGRGVLRADTPEGAAAAAERVRVVLREADPGAEPAPDPEGPLLLERYVPGQEVAVEGLLVDGCLKVLAVFDKPEPMEGPTFEETILVTPSRLPAPVRERVEEVTGGAAAALGLVEGPVHAEARVDGERVWFLELAARSIGGLCSRTLRFGEDVRLEELILRQALRLPLTGLQREEAARGVCMLYPPRPGVFRELRGGEEARTVPGIEGLELTVHPGSEVRPLPESGRYLGFLFARGDDPAAVEAALREARARLDIVVEEAAPTT